MPFASFFTNRVGQGNQVDVPVLTLRALDKHDSLGVSLLGELVG